MTSVYEIKVKCIKHIDKINKPYVINLLKMYKIIVFRYCMTKTDINLGYKYVKNC